MSRLGRQATCSTRNSQGVTVIEECEWPTINLHGHEAVINLAPGLCGASRHDAFALRDVRQQLANLAGGEERGCVQIILRSSRRVPIAKLRYEVTPTGKSFFRANGPGQSTSS